MQISHDDEVREFWQEHPCGENLTGRQKNWEEHFRIYDKYRYSTEGHILGELDELCLDGERVLEIGIGQAADSVQIAKRGGKWYGLDVTEAAVKRARIRFKLENLSYGDVKKGTATEIPWPDNTFDLVYSHGVLHHIRDVKSVAAEIKRVLRPNGRLVVMLYHKKSLNYYLSILFLRRFLFVPLYLISKLWGAKFFSTDSLTGHIRNADRLGLIKYLRAENFIHANTDGPNNPFSKVYDIDESKRVFNIFNLKETRTHFLNLRRLPGLSYLPTNLLRKLEARYGWHLWLFFEND